MRDALVAPSSADAEAGSVSVSYAVTSATALSCPAGEAAVSLGDLGERWIAAVADVAAPAVAVAPPEAAAVAVGEIRTRETAMADNVRATAVQEETHWRRWSWWWW